MANVDTPNGFTFVKTLSGAPASGMIRAIVPGADDIFIGDPITITAGAAVQMAVEGVCAGVCVGLGAADAEGNLIPLLPTDGTKKFFDTSADVEANYRILYIPSEDAIFEAQFDDSEDIVIGEAYDLLATDGNSTTGRSQMEINGDALTNDGDVVVVEKPTGPNYDQATGIANKRVWVKFVNTTFNNV